MGIDVWMAATPAPRFSDGTIDYPLSEQGAAILRRRVASLPLHIIHATGIVQGNFDLELDEAHAWTYSLLDEAITDLHEQNIGHSLVTLKRVWLVGGGMDIAQGLDWCERIAALALTGITELPLDAGPRRVAQSVTRARALARADGCYDSTAADIRALLRALRFKPDRAQGITSSTMQLLSERQDIWVDLVALRLRSAWVTS